MELNICFVIFLIWGVVGCTAFRGGPGDTNYHGTEYPVINARRYRNNTKIETQYEKLHNKRNQRSSIDAIETTRPDVGESMARDRHDGKTSIISPVYRDFFLRRLVL